MKGGGLIAKGGYGCIFHPSINTDDKKYISKVQLKDTFASKNERRISKILWEIRGSEDFFGLITKTSNVNLKKISKKDKNECSHILKDYKNDQFILMEMPYIGKNNYQEYVLNQSDNKNAFLYFIETYKRLLVAINELVKKNIVHFDLKDNNIVFNETKKIPILIDFGLSINLNKVKETLLDYFYIYAPDYYYWPLEVHYLNFILHEREEINDEDIDNISQSFVSNNKVIMNHFSPKFIQKYLNECKNILTKYKKMNTDEVIDYILSDAKKWDNYSLSIGFLQNLKGFNPVGFVKNDFISHFAGLLVQNIHPDPQRRLTPSETLIRFDQFFYIDKVNNTENFLEVLNNISEFRKEMNQQIKENIKEIKRLGSIIYISYF